MDIVYQLKFSPKKDLIVDLKDKKSSRRKLYITDLKPLFSSKEHTFLKDLLQIHRKNHPFESIDCLSCNQIVVPLKNSFSLLKKIAESKNCFYKGKVLSYFPFEADLLFTIEEKPDQTASVQSVFTQSKKPLEIDETFLEEGFIISSSYIYPIRKGLLWIEDYLEEKAISKNKKEDLLDELDEDEIPFEIKRSEKIRKTPVLVFKDPRALFSKLEVDYQGYGQFDIGTLDEKPIRDFTFEKSLLEDLKELGWIQKTEGLYLPLDGLYDSLTLLIEMGWKVEDHRKNEVVIPEKVHLNASVDKEIEIGIEDENFTELVQASLQDNLFCSVDETKVALLDPNLKKKISSLVMSGSIRGDKIILQKDQLGHLQEDHSWIKKDKTFETFQKCSGLQPLNFKGNLYAYQEKGLGFISYLYEKGFGGILADEMGLGKTVQVLAFLSCLENHSPIVICAPASLLYQWKNEVNKFLKGKNVLLYHGKDRKLDSNLENTIVLTSYQTLRADIDLFKDLYFQAVILDEATAIKNQKSLTFKALVNLESPFRLCISATPLENSIEEIFSLFTFLMPNVAKRWKKDPQSMEKEIKPFILRRLKDEVELDLPEKIEQDIWIEKSDEEKKLEEKFLDNDFEEKSSLEILTILLRLRQLNCHPALVDDSVSEDIENSSKLKVLFSELEQIFEGHHKVIVYSQFTSLLQIVEKEIVKRGYSYYYLDGKTSIQERNKRVKAFQETEEKNSIFLVSLKAGGVGLNLTGASYVYLLDPWWNDKVEEQAIARAHRIGQKKRVIAKRLYIKNSIEERIFLLKKEKSELFDRILAESDNPTTRLEKEVLLRLLDQTAPFDALQ